MTDHDPTNPDLTSMPPPMPPPVPPAPHPDGPQAPQAPPALVGTPTGLPPAPPGPPAAPPTGPAVAQPSAPSAAPPAPAFPPVAPAAEGPFEAPPDAAIATRGLVKRYGPLHAVNQVDVVIPRGSIYGLIGPNGAGKSTLMSMAASLLLPSEGRILVEGYDPIIDSAEVRSRIGYMPDGLGVYEGMVVADYLEFFAAAYRIPRSDWDGLIDGLLELVELEVKRTAQVNSLSRGMKQRLSLARSLVHDPDLLILDEPASGLDPRARIELRRLIENLNAMGKTILVSSHILTELQEVCTHVGIMEAGRLLASGSPQEILSRSQVTQRVRARFADGTEVEYDLVDDRTTDGLSRSELLRSLVLDDPREVVEFTDISQGLEDVFLTVTEGIVQ
ncbi:MAG: ABC transporter ATP-binding protein [Actinomycetota bacterium]